MNEHKLYCTGSFFSIKRLCKCHSSLVLYIFSPMFTLFTFTKSTIISDIKMYKHISGCNIAKLPSICHVSWIFNFTRFRSWEFLCNLFKEVLLFLCYKGYISHCAHIHVHQDSHYFYYYINLI